MVTPNSTSSGLSVPTATSSSAASIKSNKSGRLSHWIDRNKERVKEKLGGVFHHSKSEHDDLHAESPTPILISSDSRAKLDASPVKGVRDVFSSSSKAEGLILVVQFMFSPDIFPQNISRTVEVQLPNIGQRIEDISQLVHCARLLQTIETPSIPMDSSSTSLSTLSSLPSPTTQSVNDSPTLRNEDHEWMEGVKNKSVEKERIRQLLIGVVSEFLSNPIQDSESIREVILVGPVLEREHFRSLLTCLVAGFENAPMLAIEKLQGLVQLVQDAPSGYLEADDLIRILDAISTRLQSTSSQSSDYSFHLTLAVSRLLNVMADQSVKDLDRVLQHDPLGKALSGLKSRDNPFLRYQAIYGFQALQWVPNNESQLQRSFRLFAGMMGGLVRATGVIQFDFNGFLGGLQDIQKAVEETMDIVKAGVEDAQTMIESGQELAECLKDMFGSGKRAPWYITLRAAQDLVKRGQLADLKRLICEAPSRQGYLFQWGICQILGEIAVDPSWDVETRTQAVKFLGEIFTASTLPNVRQWILTILSYVSSPPALNSSFVAEDETIKSEASNMVKELKKTDRDEAFSFPYLLGGRLPLPMSSSLLRRVNKTTDLEPKFLKIQSELGDSGQGVYIPLMSKANLQDPGEKLDPLDERVSEFLESNKEVLLVLGDSGAGKSTYNLHLVRKLWREYQPGGSIPLFIDLKAMGNLDENDIARRGLAVYGFTDAEIQELKEYRRIILICDGYDECHQWVNIHARMKSERWKSFQIVVTCRSQYLTPNYRNYFVPRPEPNQSDSQASNLYDEAIVVPFKDDQIEACIALFRETGEATEIFKVRPIWSTEEYKTRLANIMDLVKNPFMLKLALVTLPSISGPGDDNGIQLTRFGLYEAFVNQHFNKELRRLSEQRPKMNPSEDSAFGQIENDFVIHGIHFSMRLAHLIFIEQGGVNSVEYGSTDHRGWKAQFFGPKVNNEIKFLRQSSQVVSYAVSESSKASNSSSCIAAKKTMYSFVHRSILEFFYSCRLCDFPSLNQMSIVSEPSIIHFLAERAQTHPPFQDQLRSIVDLSKADKSVAQAAANAITILVQAGVQFNGANLQGVQISGADLSGGHFDSALLQNADLSGAILDRTWLRQANFGGSRMSGVQFGEKPSLCFPGTSAMAASPKGEFLALGFEGGPINIFSTTDWSLRFPFVGHTDRVQGIVFSDCGLYLASASSGSEVRVWHLQEGSPCRVLKGHSSDVNAVAFSPCGRRLASAGKDETVRVWDLDSCSVLFVMQGHIGEVMCVKWSPSGQQIASSGEDGIVRLWHAATGEPDRKLTHATKRVWSVAYAPDHQHLFTCHENDLYQWDIQTHSDPVILKSHTNFVIAVATSRDGQWIATASVDRSIRLWDKRTRGLVRILNGHSNAPAELAFLSNQELVSLDMSHTVMFWELSQRSGRETMLHGGARSKTQGHSNDTLSVSYSPDGKSILSGSWDKSVREWDTETGTSRVVFQSTYPVTQVAYSSNGYQMALAANAAGLKLFDRAEDMESAETIEHTTEVTAVAYSSCGRWIATGDSDGAVRLWDPQSVKEVKELEGHKDDVVTGVSFSLGGQRLASWSYDETFRIFDTETGNCTSVMEHFIRAFSFSPCGQMLAWSAHGQVDDKSNLLGEIMTEIHIWDLESEQETCLLKGHESFVMSIAWSTEWIASGSSDSTVRLWKMQQSPTTASSSPSWSCIAVLREFVVPVTSLAWSPVSPQEFVSGCMDGSMGVWTLMEHAEDGQIHFGLKWGTTDRLAATGAKITNAIGLDEMQIKLLRQRGAVDGNASSKDKAMDAGRSRDELSPGTIKNERTRDQKEISVEEGEEREDSDDSYTM
ncbi:Transducin (beta)-like 3, partial [Mortierella sp. AD094]